MRPSAGQLPRPDFRPPRESPWLTFGAVRHRMPREAVVRLSPAIDLGAYYAEYWRRKRETVGTVTRRLEESVRGMVTELAALGTRVEV